MGVISTKIVNYVINFTNKYQFLVKFFFLFYSSFFIVHTYYT